MASEGLRKRAPEVKEMGTTAVDDKSSSTADTHPGGEVKHGPGQQVLRVVLLVLYFIGASFSIHISQILGSWLYFYDQEWYYAFMALMKQNFGILLITMQGWWAPTNIRVSWDKSVRGQIRKTQDGRLETQFPERLILVANHQIYSDWLYLWWISYTSRMHGHLYIILKESLKWIPLIGTGMQFFSFVFMSRKWTVDKPRMSHRLQKLNKTHRGRNGEDELNPMWLMIFPEGTNLSANQREKSRQWAEKSGTEDLKHVLLPRSTGLQFCLQELRGTVDYIYDCTIAYEGITRGEYAQDVFTLRGMYLQGLGPKSINLHWRRFAVSGIPVDDAEKFHDWVLDRWREKDEIIEQFLQTGRLPADDVEAESTMNGHAPGTGAPSRTESKYIETSVKPVSRFEVLKIFLPWLALALVLNVVFKSWRMFKGLLF